MRNPRHSAWRWIIRLSACFVLFSLFPRDLKPFPDDLYPVRVGKVSVWIDGREGMEEVKELISMKEGDGFSLKKISQSIKQISRTGLFSDVRVEKSGERDVHLNFHLTRKLFTRKVVFSGERGVPSKQLRDGLVSLRPDGVFSEDKLKKAVEEIRDVLEGAGFFQPEIRVSWEKDSKTSSVDVHFVINSGERFLIKDVIFSGDIIVPEADLRKKTASREGRPYIPSLVDQDTAGLKELYNSLGYQRAEIEVEEAVFQEEDKNVSLVFRIEPREKITFVLKGDEVPLSLIKPIWEERIFEEWGLAEGEARILSYLRKRGFLFSSADSAIERTENELRVVHEINAGKKYRIQDILFEGPSHFSPSRLKAELGIGEKIPFLGWVDGERLFELPREIELFYEIQGFSGTYVDLSFIQEDNKVTALLTVEEGMRQVIEDITLTGVSLFDPEELLGRLESREGGHFFQPNVQRDVERLETFYLNQGVRGTKISAEVDKTGENIYSLKISVVEGQKVRIERIVISGNVVTRKSIVLRELRIKEGDHAFQDAILESKRRLERLGIFSEVKIEEVAISPGRQNLVITVREGERNYAGLGVGLETKNEPRTFAIWDNVIRPRATAEFMRSNISGRGQQLSLVTQFSLKEKRGVVSWEQPYFLGFPVHTYLNAWLEREERKSFGYDRRGISLTGIKSLSRELVLLTTVRWAGTTLYYLEIEESEIDRQHYPFSSTSISGSFIWDRRDDTFNPESGSFLSGVVEWAYPLFKAESNFQKTFFKYQHFFPVVDRFNFSLTFRLGLGRGRMPIHERFFAGGSNSFRGEEFDELGPKDPRSLKPIGGKALVLFNFEFRFPVVSSLRNLTGAVFLDSGNVYYKRKEFHPTAFRNAAGVGIRYKTPLGPLRFDLGWNLDSSERWRKPLAFITIGNVF